MDLIIGAVILKLTFIYTDIKVDILHIHVRLHICTDVYLYVYLLSSAFIAIFILTRELNTKIGLI